MMAMTWRRLTGLLAGLWLSVLAGMCPAGPGLTGSFAERPPLVRDAGRPLVALEAGARPAGRASLFAGRAEGGLLSAPPARARDAGSVRARLRDLIASAEAGHAGYDAVQSGAHRPPPRRPTAMTLREIFAWIEATPGQHHAIGRYQIIPATLRRLVARAGLSPDTRYGERVQDRLADLLMDDAGLGAMQRGEISREAFQLNLAKVWAGLPTPSGRSYYHGLAGNRAVISYDTYSDAVRAILDG
jgi:hypothetical protein